MYFTDDSQRQIQVVRSQTKGLLNASVVVGFGIQSQIAEYAECLVLVLNLVQVVHFLGDIGVGAVHHQRLAVPRPFEHLAPVVNPDPMAIPVFHATSVVVLR